MTIQPHDPHVRYTAEQYDHFTAKFTGQFDEALVPVIVTHAAKRMPGAVLLDIGTGTARFLIHLARVPALAGLRLVGTDLFDDMLDRARRAAAEAGVAIELQRQDVHEMDLPAGFADIVTSRSTVHHWRDPAQAFREIDRVLKPRGVAFISDVRRDAPPDALAEFNRLREAAGLGPTVIEEKYTASELAQFCREAGLADRFEIFSGTEGLFALGLTLMITKRPRERDDSVRAVDP